MFASKSTKRKNTLAQRVAKMEKKYAKQQKLQKLKTREAQLKKLLGR